jgi:type IV pilus assembly protein PilY1
MHRSFTRGFRFIAVALMSTCLGSVAQADDSEIFIQKEISGGAANLLLVLDTSGSMHNTAVTEGESQKPYDSRLRYPDNSANCQDDSIYYRHSDPLNTTPPTTCDGLERIELDSNSCSNGGCNRCNAAGDLLFGTGRTGRSGSYLDYFIRWRGSSGSNRTWSPELRSSSGGTTGRDLECRADAGVHGFDATSSDKFPRPGNNSGGNNRYGSSSQSWWAISGNTGKRVVMWSPNRIRYERTPVTADTLSRMQVVKQAAIQLLDSPMLTGMNVGLMRYSQNAQGGMILWPVSPLTAASRQSMVDLINGIVEAGNTPLSETLFEAHQYFAGKPVEYGDTSTVCLDTGDAPNSGGNASNCRSDSSVSFPSHPSSISSGSYISPADASCQNNYIVYLTDGMPTGDGTVKDREWWEPYEWDGQGVRKMVEELDQFEDLELACDDERRPDEGQCFVALSAYLNKADLRLDVDGTQSVRTFYIGFGDEFAGNLAGGPFAFLQTAAAAGGGEAFQAGDLPQLEGAFNSILASVADTNTTFSAPTVAVNAFNRTQTLNDLYVAVFQPSTGRHWPGNLKKYRLVDGEIVDTNDDPAVDPNSGFFHKDAQSVWSTSADGYDVKKGGAANLIPGPDERVVYSYIGDTTPSSPVTLGASHVVSTDNYDEADLGIGNADDPALADLVAWLLGKDVRDLDPENNDAEEARHVMGDPMHTQPAVVIYSGTEEDPEAVVFMPTNDGYLHAVDSESGEELWAFIPQEVLPQLKHLYVDANTDTKHYLLDGEVRVLKFDVDGDGTIETGDRVFIYFSQGRGGSNYYALDVTDKDSPKFMWSLGGTDLNGVGQTWSPPVITRMNIGDGSDQNSQKLVLVFGGGYDDVEESENFVASNSTGNRLYIVDALTGELLWWAGGPNSAALGANLTLDEMTHSIPSRVSVLDTNQDGFADRLYVGDMGGQVWRFDFFNSKPAALDAEGEEIDGTAVVVEADDFALGGVIASLGGKADDADEALDARRFFNAPDVAALQTDRDPPYLNITIGSGHRGKPLSEATDDRLYVIRDYIPFRPMTATEYEDLEPLIDGDLEDITEDVTPTIPADSPGWKLRLSTGEKVLSDTTTFSGTIFFVTYTGDAEVAEDTCVQNSAGAGTNRAYMVNAKNGAPVRNLRDTTIPDGNETDPDGDDELTPEDRSTELEQGGIAAGVTFLFPEANKLVCLSGVEVLGACNDFNSRVKTYWREASGL